MWGTNANIYRDIPSLPFDDSAQLGLRMGQLIVESAQRPLGGTGVVLLYEGVANPELGELPAVVRLREKAPNITNDVRGKLPHIGKRCFYSPQGIRISDRHSGLRRPNSGGWITLSEVSRGHPQEEAGPDGAIAWREESRFS